MAAAEFSALRDYLGSQILGQEELIEGLLIALLCEGHVLIEGAPGLAKTRAVKALAGAVEGRFARIQFTPDLLPADLTGSEVFHPQDASFVFQPGPCSTIWCWQTRSTGHRPRYNQRCWKPWPSTRSP